MEEREFSHIDVTPKEDSVEILLLAKRRCCFCIPCFGSSNRSSTTVKFNWWQRVSSSNSNNGDREDGSLWGRGFSALKKLREWSEIVAGPRWKTFIRRFNRSKSGGGGGNRSSKYQYDPMSYALNFDEGPGQNGNFEEDDDAEYRFRNFSSRYASIPTSMDLGKDVAGPSFV